MIPLWQVTSCIAVRWGSQEELYRPIIPLLIPLQQQNCTRVCPLFTTHSRILQLYFIIFFFSDMIDNADDDDDNEDDRPTFSP